MKIIGIMNTLKIKNDNEPYDCYYKFIKLYTDRIKENGCLAVGILDTDDLSIYDAIILPGGNMIKEDHYKVIDYCIKHKIPCLGICMGMQAMVLYDYLMHLCKQDKLDVLVSDLVNKYEELVKQKNYILTKFTDHGGELSSGTIDATFDNVLKSKHSINIQKDTFLDDIYHTDKLDVVSMHNYGYGGLLNDFEVVATSDDRVVEAISHKNTFIWGVQFHIEVEKDNKVLKTFLNKIK